MHTNKPAHLKIPNTSTLHTHTFSQWTAWLVLGSAGRRRWKRRRRLHLCRKVGCLAASSGRSAIHPSHPSLLASTQPLTPLPPPPHICSYSPPPLYLLPWTTNISILLPFMWRAEVWLASTAVVWYSGRMMSDCLLGCHTHTHTDTRAACTGFMCYRGTSRKLLLWTGRHWLV